MLEKYSALDKGFATFTEYRRPRTDAAWNAMSADSNCPNTVDPLPDNAALYAPLRNSSSRITCNSGYRMNTGNSKSFTSFAGALPGIDCEQKPSILLDLYDSVNQ